MLVYHYLQLHLLYHFEVWCQKHCQWSKPEVILLTCQKYEYNCFFIVCVCLFTIEYVKFIDSCKAVQISPYKLGPRYLSCVEVFFHWDYMITLICIDYLCSIADLISWWQIIFINIMNSNIWFLSYGCSFKVYSCQICPDTPLIMAACDQTFAV